MPESPRCTVDEFSPRSADYCVAVFVINENGRLHSQLGKMKPHTAAVDVVVADGGSTDGSTEHETLRDLGVNTLLTKTEEGKLGTQMRMAFAWALDRGYRGVVVMDGNDKDDPEAIPRFVAALEAGGDHVQGSRFVRGGVAVNTPLSRHLGIKLLHAPMIARASGFAYTDTTNGFRAYSRRFLEDERVAPLRPLFTGYELHYYLAIRAAELGFAVEEIPVTRAYPAEGKTPTKISPLRGNLKVIRTLLRACRHEYDPIEGETS